jgi:branched-chain amino acid transport system ATP-binding protein
VPDERVSEALEFVGLRERASDKPGNLPLFDKKRLMLASALVLEPRLLLLDEPAAGLNQVEIAQTIELIRRINGQGITIILIEHVLPLLLALSQRIMVLNQGSKLVEGTPRTVISDERVIEAYLGRRSTRDR